MTLSQTVSALLASAKILLPFNVLFAAFTFWQANGIGFVLSAIISAWIAYLHLRIDFDRRIFHAFAQGMQPEHFDFALQIMGLQRIKAPTRDLENRAKGAIKLLKYLIYSTFIQLFWLISA
ncbi:hypothetical protein MIS46_11285 [Wielerella bovis]|uniref:hypothetical protein n=1 Tax=Wielerella bovis TaxID=2917790 RepID=UPI0020193991|nr:hypothetical protein [Wielerella bovis]ULJ62505.1 hypothetical protein MIS46_11285 [Wielerella bovis]